MSTIVGHRDPSVPRTTSRSSLAAAALARPLAFWTAAFVLGDLFGLLLPGPLLLLLLFLCATSVAGTAIALRVWPRISAPADRRFGLAILVAAAFYALGFARGFVATLPPAHDVVRFAGRFVELAGRVASDPKRTARGWSFDLVPESARLGEQRFPAEGNVLVWIAKGPGPPDRPPYDPGDRLTVHGRLERPEPERNPGGYDAEAVLSGRAVRATLIARHSSDVRERSPSSEFPLDRLAVRLRESYLSTMERMLGREQAGLLGGVALGARARLPALLEDDFARTGTIHVLATAGLHVGLVAFVLHWLWQVVLGRPRAAALGTITCLILYDAAAGGRPAVARAVFMASIYLAATVLNREPDGATALAATALFFLVRSPALVLDAGFQLTFVTVGVMMALLAAAQSWSSLRDPGTERSLADRAKEWALALPVVSLAAQIGSAPLTAFYFHLVSPMALLANLLVVPMAALALVGSLVLWPLGLAVPDPAGAIGRAVLAPALSGMAAIVSALAGLPGAALGVPSPGWPAVAGLYAVLFWLAFRLRRSRPPAAWKRTHPGHEELALSGEGALHGGG